MRVIGISGPDGCGKSTLAEAIMSRISDRFHAMRIPFAEPVRQEVRTLLVYDRSDADVWQKPTPDWLRQLLRGWTDYKRSREPDYWVQRWLLMLETYRQAPSTKELLVVVDDVRYSNGVDVIHDLGGTVIYLDDVAVPDHQLLHELLDVRGMADMGFTVNSRSELWADANAVLEAIDL